MCSTENLIIVLQYLHACQQPCLGCKMSTHVYLNLYGQRLRCKKIFFRYFHQRTATYPPLNEHIGDTEEGTRALSQYKDSLFRYGISSIKIRLSYLYNGNSYTSKMTSKIFRWAPACLAMRADANLLRSQAGRTWLASDCSSEYLWGLVKMPQMQDQGWF